MSNIPNKLLLGLDGGGTKCAVELKILSWLNSDLQKKFASKVFTKYNKSLSPDKQYTFKSLMDEVDVIGGVSAGAINAAALSIRDDKGNLKHSPDALLDAFLSADGELFEEKMILPGIFSPAMTCHGLEKLLNTESCGAKFQVFDEGVEKPELVMTSLNLQWGHPTILTNIGTTIQRATQPYCVDNIENVSMTDAVLASSSAPIVLGAHAVKYSRDCKTDNYLEIDGTAMGNSPLLELVSLVSGFEKVPLSNMFVLSVSCGTKDADLTSLANAGMLQFARNLSDFLSQQIISIADKEKTLLKTLIEGNGGKCYLINPKLTPDQYAGGFDDTAAGIKKHIQTADNFINSSDGHQQLSEISGALFDFICERHGLDYHC